jgi:O-acetylserine/cysteine efflux transporter
MGLFAVPQLALASMLVEHDQLQAVTGADWLGWGALAYQAVVVVIICYGIWFRLLSRYTVNQVMPYTLLVPVFGVLSGVVLLDEPVTWSLIFGGAATIAGVATIVLAPVPPTIGGTRTP